MHPMRSTKRSLLLLAVGAAFAYLWDPQSGRTRREQILAKLQGYVPSSGATEGQASADTDPSGAASTIPDAVEPPPYSSPAEVVLTDLPAHDNGAPAPREHRLVT